MPQQDQEQATGGPPAQYKVAHAFQFLKFKEVRGSTGGPSKFEATDETVNFVQGLLAQKKIISVSYQGEIGTDEDASGPPIVPK